MRLTKQRRRLLTLIEKEQKPFSAESLLSLLPEKEMNLSTVYRNLDYFHQVGVLTKSVIEGTSYYYPTHGDHLHYMICRGCLKMFPVDCTLDKMAKDAAKKHDFTITHHDMTIYGYCHECRALNSKSERE
ncbi:MAG TPA: hypothetical protein DCX17_03055 [Firmicutes bacterium]|jgi:Fur family ferric uptake transcriptional regulator|nr:hypothetical protein [Bacillota bacterium]